MLAVVISTNTNYFYVANNVNGLTMSAQVMTNGGAVDTNIYQALGLPATIGGDPGTDPARNYGGYIRSVALFSNSLTVAQIETLFNAGARLGRASAHLYGQPAVLPIAAGELSDRGFDSQRLWRPADDRRLLADEHRAGHLDQPRARLCS